MCSERGASYCGVSRGEIAAEIADGAEQAGINN